VSIRKRNDAQGYRRGAMGIDGDKGGDYSKRYNQNSWDVTPSGAATERSYSRNSKRGQDQWTEVGATEQPLRNVEDFGTRAKTREIWSDVNENDGPRGGASAAIRAGVNRSQED
jgi:hypothetical protein